MTAFRVWSLDESAGKDDGRVWEVTSHGERFRVLVMEGPRADLEGPPGLCWGARAPCRVLLSSLSTATGLLVLYIRRPHPPPPILEARICGLWYAFCAVYFLSTYRDYAGIAITHYAFLRNSEVAAAQTPNQ